jgi:hypothetical protein
VRAAVLVLCLALSVLIHHHLTEPAGPSGMGSAAAMTMTTAASHPWASDAMTHASQPASPMATGASCPAGCTDDQMCAAAALAKAPSMAPVLLSAVTGNNATGHGAETLLGDDAAPPAPPDVSAILRI